MLQHVALRNVTTSFNRGRSGCSAAEIETCQPMSPESLPSAAEPESLTAALRRSGALRDERVSKVVIESSRKTILSQIIRLNLSYDGAAADAPRSVILKT